MIRFYLDEDLSPTIARIAHHLGLDVTGAHDARDVATLGWTDPEQLAYAATQGRCIVTGNGRDFVGLLAARYGAGKPAAGIAAVPGNWARGSFGRIAHALVLIAADYPDGLPAYLFVYLG